MSPPEPSRTGDPRGVPPADRLPSSPVGRFGFDGHLITRRRFISLSVAASAGFAVNPLLTACTTTAATPTLAEGTLERARRQGFIRVGFANEAPYGYVDDSGRLTGAAPELAREVMRRLGVPELDGVLTPFGSLISGLDDGRFDLIAAGMFITPQRCDQILFSDPDYCVEQAFLVTGNNPYAIQHYEDVAAQPKVKLGVLTGAVEATQATEAGVSPSYIRRFDNPTDLLNALRAGRIDAAALTTISVTNLAAQADFDGVEVTEAFTYGDQPGCGAFGFRLDDVSFRDQFNQVLADLKSQGAATPLVEPFGFGDAAQAANGLTATEVCTN